ncbi:Aromatic-ring hydroxylase-like protein [Macrophomina phaseolina MS6]|uniref:Aromatic-ring hydroxylase-like protein n=1 Tax=Macrophomina phaseolina (strain MS6) TaxID=1126212 RepID=K2RN32_MACPH|nr:Aromatic-ring hydroxylase-like protein [Macrophomina phaseolina MS6]
MTDPASSPKKLDIAIIGSGIAGLAVAIGLLRANIAVTIYEAANAFYETGVGLGLAPNALKALHLISPEMKKEVDKITMTNAWPSKKNNFMEARRGVSINGVSPDDSKGLPASVYSVQAPNGLLTVHRARLLELLCSLVPDGMTTFNKRLDDITPQADGRVLLAFRDGSAAVHDAVIGCDGVKSRARQVLLGEEHAAANACFSGKYAYRGLLAADKAVEIVGEELALNNQLYLGHHGHVVTYPIEKGTLVNTRTPILS